MELATCDIEVDVTSYYLVRTEKEGVANSVANRLRFGCESQAAAACCCLFCLL
jgi:hypothetical protein